MTSATDSKIERKRAQLEERTQRILDVTEQFARDAERLDDLSPSLIAELAQVSVGWLYSHIGDRQAVVDRVLLRGLLDVQRTSLSIGLDLSSEGWRDQLDLMVDTTVAFLRSRPGFTRLYYSRLAGPATAEINFQIDQQTGMSFVSFSELGLSEELGAAVASMTAGIFDKGIEIAFRLDGAASDAAIDQTKAASKAYLALYIDR